MTLEFSVASRSCFIPISEAYVYSDGAVLCGLSRDELFRRSYLDPNVQNSISLGQLVLLSMNTMIETDDLFSGRGRRAYPPSHLALMLRLMMACDTLGRAIGSIANFHKMEQPISIGLNTDELEAQLYVSCDDAFGGESTPVIEDIYLNTIFGGLSYFLGRRLPVTSVMTRSQGQTPGARHWSMSAPVHIGGMAAISFPVSLLAATRQANPTDDICWTVLHHRLALDNEASKPLAVRAVSIKQLNTAVLCDELGISSATFRRRNDSAGESFRCFRENTLIEASLSLLSDETRSVSSIAAELGYSDVRSYRRFIKGATGSTPDQLRTNSIATRMRKFEPEVMARIKEIAICLSR